MKKIRLPLGLFLLAVAGAAAWWWLRAGDAQAIVATALPPLPELNVTVGGLRGQIRAADARARARLTASAGLMELSRLYHANGFLAEATRCYEGLERLAPAEPRWPHRHATILAGFGEIEPAIQLWRRVLQLAPDYEPARLRLGDCLLKGNQPAAAAATYAEVLARNPDNAYALLGLARIDWEAGNLDQARQRLEIVVSRTNYTLGYDLIVSLYERLGQRARAAAIRASAKASGAYHDAPDPWVDELIDFCFDPYRLSLEAGAAARYGHPDRARQLLTRAIALAPEDVSPHFQLGCFGESQRDFPLAQEQLELCTRLAPDFADGWAHLSAVQASLGNRPAADATLAAGLARCPGSPGLHLMRARNERQAGHAVEAMNEYAMSIRLRPNEPEAYDELGTLYLENGHVEAGVQKIKEALEADPGDPMALGILAFNAITTGNEALARDWLARVARQPRLPAEQNARLQAAYRQAFGHDWVPPKSDD